jgi:hypothetical protein
MRFNMLCWGIGEQDAVTFFWQRSIGWSLWIILFGHKWLRHPLHARYSGTGWRYHGECNGNTGVPVCLRAASAPASLWLYVKALYIVMKGKKVRQLRKVLWCVKWKQQLLDQW